MSSTPNTASSGGTFTGRSTPAPSSRTPSGAGLASLTATPSTRYTGHFETSPLLGGPSQSHRTVPSLGGVVADMARQPSYRSTGAEGGVYGATSGRMVGERSVDPIGPVVGDGSDGDESHSVQSSKDGAGSTGDRLRPPKGERTFHTFSRVYLIQCLLFNLEPKRRRSLRRIVQQRSKYYIPVSPFVDLSVQVHSPSLRQDYGLAAQLHVGIVSARATTR